MALPESAVSRRRAMSALVEDHPRCIVCGTGEGEISRDFTGDLLCLNCYADRQETRGTLSVAHSAGSSWTPVDLAAILSGDHEPEEPCLLRRADGVGLLY